MITFHIITIFPEVVESYAAASLLGKAQQRKLVKVHPVNLRAFGRDRRRTVDDRAYGGGPGMVLKVEPIYRAVAAIKSKLKGRRSRVVLFSTRGKPFTQAAARRLSRSRDLILIAGRYEGVDERVARHIADEEISIGDYVLSGGELPALVVAEAVSRHIPGVLGKQESLEEKKGSYPVFTRPEAFSPRGCGRAWRVPRELLSGNHREIERWRNKFGRR